MEIVVATHAHVPVWSDMRMALWPCDSATDHADEARRLYIDSNPDRIALIALSDAGAPIGFAEATVRRDYVDGCETSPVAFLEGIYVRPSARREGAARALSAAVADWGRARGCAEYASNALLDNLDSHAFHAAIGFSETERVVFFRKDLS